ncbi:MAG: helix-hairpin-helix domain-containing protein [Lachnospiraceae bacterium]|nr:helix-hairpin-helix domain-containing protein [Lachnospiraceae bacterium]
MKKIIIFVLCIVLLSACGSDRDIEFILEEGEKINQEDSNITEPETERLESKESGSTAAAGQPKDTELKTATLFVYVCGAVNHPGVYELPEGSRLYEVLSKAGGLAEDAQINLLNQAAILTDGQMIYVPTIGEDIDELSKENEAAQARSTLAGGADSNLVNINTAERDILLTLPGIGQSKADAIIEYRDSHGSFSKIEDIMQVAGIKEKLFSQIKDKIRV